MATIPASTLKAAAASAANTDSKAPRRKPRKLNQNKEPAKPATAPASQGTAKATAVKPITTPTAKSTTTPSKIVASSTPKETTPSVAPVPNAELEALKNRVRGLEAKVEELYKSTSERRNSGARSPRRRGKGRKGSAQSQIQKDVVELTDATCGVKEKGKEKEEEKSDDSGDNGRIVALDDEEELDEVNNELVRLEGELEVARQDLASYRHPSAKSHKGSHSHHIVEDDDEDIEEIPRDYSPTSPGITDEILDSKDRQVTLTGSYRIPLPSSVSLKDVKSIKEGVSAAQSVAKSFLDEYRKGQGREEIQGENGPRTSTRERGNRSRGSGAGNAGTAVARADSKSGTSGGWSEWFGGYSMAISRVVNNIQHEAAVESQKIGPSSPSHQSNSADRRPVGRTRTSSASSTATAKAAAKKTPPATKATSAAQKMPLKPNMGNSIAKARTHEKPSPVSKSAPRTEQRVGR